MNSEFINRILVGVKNMPEAAPALRFVGAIAKILNANITLLSVIGAEGEHQVAEKALQSALKILPGLEVETKVIINPKPAQIILAELESGGYDLLVVSAIGKSFLAALASGSATRYMIEHTHRPLLVVKGECNDLRNLLICTGGSEIAKPVIRNGARLAQAVQARVTLLHVSSQVPSMYTGLGEIEETLDELLQTDTPLAQHLRWCAKLLDRYDLTAEIKLRHGIVANEILREAQMGNYDLIVLGAHIVTSPWKELMMDNVAHQVVERALCAILMIYGGMQPVSSLETG